MSASLYAYSPEKCDGKACVGDCDLCPRNNEEESKAAWIKISPAFIYECSKCGKQVCTGDIEAYEFCHGCGRKIGGVKE